MTQNRLPLIAGILTLATLLIGGAAFVLLLREQGRAVRGMEADLEFKARTLAQQIQNHVALMQEEMMTQLVLLAEQPEAGLIRLRDRDPMVRGVFYLDRFMQRRLPRIPANEEERRFLERYQRLFSDRDAWTPVRPEAEEYSEGFFSSISKKGLQPPSNLGWKTWFWEDGFYLLAWHRADDQSIRGLELETMNAFARLLPLLNETAPEQGRFSVFDHAGRPFFKNYSGEIEAPAEISVPVGPALPHWRVTAHPDLKAPARSGNLLLVAGIFLVTMIATMLVGVRALVRQTEQHMRDAAQKTSFVSNVSHELKTPLTTIRMYAELIGAGRVKDTEKQKTYLDVIISESQRLTRLVNNVLEFGRLERGNRKMRLVSQVMRELIERILETQQPRFEKTDIACHFTAPDSDLHALVDPDAFEQVLLNLLDNAVKYGCTDQGGDIDVNLAAKDDKVTIRVRDHGPGVPEYLREKIFGKFFRANQSLAAEHAGSGIGLSIARLIIAQFKGSLAYEQPSGKGGCFLITLPIAQELEQ
ncbi:MAG: HAMP domain-containing sensor histidine kinase [Acidobacteriota bacterium]|nr:HAMP domain-containing sensor histidine kinase [Acidobacteriota bacterium]